MKENMNTIEEFKRYATSSFFSEYFKSYVNALDKDELNWFYREIKEVLVCDFFNCF